ncbi:MAG: AAA family ATPase [Campylobacteraceae bacterium]|jgi:predicted ATPase|nr:AAA family ATPase [Campylobacteraceae bacterium]
MQYKNWLNYWKKSLSDSLMADINIEKLQYFEIENFDIEACTVFDIEQVNKLIDYEEIQINKKSGIYNKKSSSWQKIEKVHVIISPVKFRPLAEHLVFLGDKSTKFPFWFNAVLDRNGQLLVPDETFPLFQRRYLEPLADEKTEFIFSSIENADIAATIGKEHMQTYAEYIDYVKNIFKALTAKEFQKYNANAHETIYNGIIALPDKEVSASFGIIQLYEKILKENIPELLKTFITLKNDLELKPLEVSQFINVNFLHIGQMGFEFPISISQRKSLYTFLNSNDKVLAVNGPPGTGKTTLLQSIVANKFVQNAIKGDDAPIILACSTNNQAVTNIMDSFSTAKTKSGYLQNRWLPDIEGYATYLPSNNKENLKQNYKKQNGEGLFSKIENNEYLQKAKSVYLDKAKLYLKSSFLDIRTAMDKLQNEIKEIEKELKNASLFWSEYINAEEIFKNIYADKELCLHELLDENVLQNYIKELNSIEKKIISYFKTEPLINKFFCFLKIKTALENRSHKIDIILRDSVLQDKIIIYNENNILKIIDLEIKTAKNIIHATLNWKKWKMKNSIIGNPPKTKEQYWSFEYLKIKDALKPNCFYDELDVGMRHKAFQLALHYWEGRYLQKLEFDLKDKNFNSKGKEATINRWKRQAMLTPCFVSTFYMAPKFFISYNFLKTTEDGKNIYDTPALFDFIDLLIVDEAGQVSPEIGTATFSLAKQAIVVGDTKQIEPVWNITNKIDIGNLKECGIISDYNDTTYEKEFSPKGFLASNGSIIKMAQNASNFKDDNMDEKGLFLVEHRRCYDEIINYCNVLAYNGQLKPLRGTANNLLFPPMYCIHVDANSMKTNSGSRYNKNEVNAIVNWLKENKEQIKNRYEKVEESIGIITPFTEQKNILMRELKKNGFDINELKIGTVHALQGAERAIILFSMVYGKEDFGSMFFDKDNKPNMLNVAVSRAKDNFIVFADTKIFNKKAKTPSGILSNYLVYENGANH